MKVRLTRLNSGDITSNQLRAISLSSGFTIVELLVVVVVIGILAAVTVVSYIGIQQKAVVALLQSNLTNGSQQLRLYQVTNGAYPNFINDCPTPATSNICLKASPGNIFTYNPNNSVTPQTFTLDAMNGSTVYRVTNDSPPVAAAIPTCPSGFIVVPGSSIYGTSDFCVMKYEAKRVGVTSVPISQANGSPWVYITQADAITNSANVADCTGCHLITEPEWLTIAQNVLSVPSNWSGGVVGSGYIYNGHNDTSPTSALDADNNDDNGYFGTGNVTPSNQRRTLTLSNGQVIWDLAGNVLEWTNATIAGGQQPGLSGESAYAWKQWNNGSLLRNGLPTSAMPGYTGVYGASNWSSTQGIGQLYSNYGEAGVRTFLRGGSWGSGSGAGVLSLYLGAAPSDGGALASLLATPAAVGSGSAVGFRVSR